MKTAKKNPPNREYLIFTNRMSKWAPIVDHYRLEDRNTAIRHFESLALQFPGREFRLMSRPVGEWEEEKI